MSETENSANWPEVVSVNSQDTKSNEKSPNSDEYIKCPINCCNNEKVDAFWKLVAPFNLIILMLMLGFSNSLRIRCKENLIYRQLCVDRLKEDYMVCYNIQEKHNITKKDLEVIEIIKDSNSHVLAVTGLKIIIEAISASFLCSWSDKYGRKFPLLIAMVGEIFDISAFLFRNLLFQHFLWAFYITTLFSGLFGGYICIFAMLYCIVTDHSPSKYRALNFTLIDFTYVAGIIFGVVAFKNFIKNEAVSVSIFTIIGVKCIMIIWIILTFSDMYFEQKSDNLSMKIKHLFSAVHIKRTCKAISRSRNNCEKELAILLIWSVIPVMIAYTLIEGIILTSTTHAKLFVNFEKYEKTTLIFALYTSMGEPIGLVIYQLLSKFKDSTVGIIGFWNLYLSFFIGAFAIDNITFLVGLGITPLKGFAVVSLRSAYSKIPKEDERGKLFFFYACSEVVSIFIVLGLYEKLRLILTAKDDILPHMVVCTMLLLPLSTFVFQVMSINTSHLFAACYRERKKVRAWECTKRINDRPED